MVYILLSVRWRAYFCRSIAVEVGGVSRYFSKDIGVRGRCEIPQRGAKHESNRSKEESRKIDSLSESHPINMREASLESHDSKSLDSRFRIADSVPLRILLILITPKILGHPGKVPGTSGSYPSGSRPCWPSFPIDS